MWFIDRPPQWVGRGQELAILRAGVEALGRGEGAVVWVEGEPGIGKSSLVAEALAAGSAQEWWDNWWIGTCRPTPRRTEVQELRAAVVRRGGAVVTLGPLTETEPSTVIASTHRPATEE